MSIDYLYHDLSDVCKIRNWRHSLKKAKLFYFESAETPRELMALNNGEIKYSSTLGTLSTYFEFAAVICHSLRS